MKTNRRKFLGRTTAGCAAALTVRPSLLQAVEAVPRLEVSSNRFTIRAYDAGGEPLSASALQGLFCFEAGADRNPLPHPKREITTGRVQAEAPELPFGFAQMTAVDGFGTVRLYADHIRS